jgi:hypothetical protein
MDTCISFGALFFARFLDPGKIEQNACYEWFSGHYTGSKNRAKKSYRFRQPKSELII